MMSAAAAEGEGIRRSTRCSSDLTGWLRSGGEADLIVPAVSKADDRGVDRLFRQLVPDVTGRRSGHEIIHRLRRKWDLSHSLSRYPRASARPGSRPVRVTRAGAESARAARTRSSPHSRRSRSPAWKSWSRQLGERGVEESRIELDLGFSRGIGFYTQMIFELEVSRRPPARSKSAAAGDTTAWPACWAAAATTAGPGLHSGWNGWPKSAPARPRRRNALDRV